MAAKSASASITRPDNTDAYTANDVISNSTSAPTVMTFSNVLPTDYNSASGSGFTILGVRLRIDANAVPSGMAGFRLHLYNAAPTAINDNAAFNLPSADRSKYLGYITISTPVDIGDTLWAEDDNVNFSGALASGSTSLYGILETLGAFTPSSQTVKTITINTVAM